MKKVFTVLLALVVITPGYPQTSTFNAFADKFAVGYKAINIPKLELSYAEGFKKIKPAAEV